MSDRGGADGWLSLAAAPTFGIMALVSAVQDGGAAAVLCGSSAWTGMTAMYGLMTVFHASPWLRLIAGWRPAALYRRRVSPDGAPAAVHRPASESLPSVP